MKTLDLVAYNKNNTSFLGVREQFVVRKRTKGIALNLVVCLSPTLQPLIAYTTKDKVAVEVTEERLKNGNTYSLFYPLKNVGYVLDIRYLQNDDGTEKFNYTLYIPSEIKKDKMYCEKGLSIQLKNNLIDYFKQECLQRKKYRYKGKVKF